MSNVIIALFTLVAIVVAFRSQQHQAETESVMIPIPISNRRRKP
ncbi:hypothetical protein [Crocosphaera sp. Alani8]